MSKKTTPSGGTHEGTPMAHAAVGVIKFDYKTVGYPEILKIAKDWAKDENYQSIIVRKVTKDNWGIQFVYMSNSSESNQAEERISKLKKEMEGLYAVDYNYSSNEDLEQWFTDQILVHKELRKEDYV